MLCIVSAVLRRKILSMFLFIMIHRIFQVICRVRRISRIRVSNTKFLTLRILMIYLTVPTAFDGHVTLDLGAHFVYTECYSHSLNFH